MSLVDMGQGGILARLLPGIFGSPTMGGPGGAVGGLGGQAAIGAQGNMGGAGGGLLAGLMQPNPLLDIGLGLLSAGAQGQRTGQGLASALGGARQQAMQQQRATLQQQMIQAQLAALRQSIETTREKREREEEDRNAFVNLAQRFTAPGEPGPLLPGQARPGEGLLAAQGVNLSAEDLVNLSRAAPKVAQGLLASAVSGPESPELEPVLRAYQQAVAMGLAEPGAAGFAQFQQSRSGPGVTVNLGDKPLSATELSKLQVPVSGKPGEYTTPLPGSTSSDIAAAGGRVKPPQATEGEAMREGAIASLGSALSAFESAMEQPDVTQGARPLDRAGMLGARLTGIGLDAAEADADTASEGMFLALQQAATRGDVSEGEAKRLQALVPRREDPAEVRRAKIEQIRMLLSQRRRAQAAARGTDAPTVDVRLSPITELEALPKSQLEAMTDDDRDIYISRLRRGL